MSEIIHYDFQNRANEELEKQLTSIQEVTVGALRAIRKLQEKLLSAEVAMTFAIGRMPDGEAKEALRHALDALHWEPPCSSK